MQTVESLLTVASRSQVECGGYLPPIDKLEILRNGIAVGVFIVAVLAHKKAKWEFRTQSSAKYIDPVRFLGAVKQAVANLEKSFVFVICCNVVESVPVVSLAGRK